MLERISYLKNSLNNNELLIKFASKNLNVFAYLLNFSFLVLFYLYFRPIFQTEDDGYSFLPSTPAYGDWFVNYNLGFTSNPYFYVITYLSRCFPDFNIYGILLVALNYVSFSGLSILLLRLFGVKLALLINILFLLIFGIDICYALQFTVTAGLCTGIGLLTIFHLYFQKGADKFLMFSCILLLVFGMLIRLEMVYVSFFCVTTFFIYTKQKSIIPSLFKIGIIIFGLVVLIKLADKYVDKYSGENREYLQFMTKIHDYGYLKGNGYALNKPIFDKINLDSIEVSFLNTWCYQNRKILTNENVRILNNSMQKDYGDKIVQLTQKDFYVVFFREHSRFLVIAILISLIAILVTSGNLRWQAGLIPMVTYLVLYIMMFVFLKKPPMRVMTPVLISLLVTILLTTKFEGKKNGKIVVSILIVIGTINLFKIHYLSKKSLLCEEISETVLDSKFDKGIYIDLTCGGASIPYNYCGVFKLKESFLKPKIIFATAANSGNVLFENGLKRNGFDDLYMEIPIKGTKVLILEQGSEQMLNAYKSYYFKHYKRKISEKLVFFVDKFPYQQLNCYQFYFDH